MDMKDDIKLPRSGYYFVKAAERPVKPVQASKERRPRSGSSVGSDNPELVRELRKRFRAA
ncbi:MAG: hypothetical protein ITG02_14770 [Patulibacter sp.]|nr:hypothetical protein [Patulibacter sp.]